MLTLQHASVDSIICDVDAATVDVGMSHYWMLVTGRYLLFLRLLPSFVLVQAHRLLSQWQATRSADFMLTGSLKASLVVIFICYYNY